MRDRVGLMSQPGPSFLSPNRLELAVLCGEVVLDGAGGCRPAECAVGSVVIVEVDEAVVAGVALSL